MTDMPDRDLVDWLQAGPDRGPQHGLERALAATRRTTQRPRWSLPQTWAAAVAARWVDDTSAGQRTILGAVAALAVVALSVTVGLSLLARPAGIGGPVGPTLAPPSVLPASPSPTPSPSPSPSVTPVPGYGTTPPNWATPAPLAPATPLPSPTGDAVPATLLGRQYNVDPPAEQDSQALVLTLRAADDPHCTAMYNGGSTCFTILWTPNYPRHVYDKAVRGPARIVDGNLVLGFALVPNDPTCEGTSSTYSISPDGWTLRGTDVPACSFQGFTRH